MSGMTGHEVVRRLRTGVDAGGDRPLSVGIAGWGDDADRKRSVDAGCDAHLTKPVDAEQVTAFIAAAAAEAARGPAPGRGAP